MLERSEQKASKSSQSISSRSCPQSTLQVTRERLELSGMKRAPSTHTPNLSRPGRKGVDSGILVDTRSQALEGTPG